MTPRNLVLAAIAVCAIAAAMLLGMQLGAHSTVPAAADVDPQPTGEVFAPAVRDPVERPLPLARPSPDPLPPVDAPLADTFEELMVRADRGDDRAACRLALEMQACYWAEQRSFYSPMPMEIPSQQDTARMDAAELENLELAIASAELRLEEARVMQARCDGVPELPFGRQLGWLRQAALAGHPAAVHDCVSGDAFQGHLWIRESQYLETYRRDLVPMAWRAMEAGDLEMAWRLMTAYTPQPDMMRSDPLAQMVDADPVTALALARFLSESSARADGHEDSIRGFRALADSVIGQLEVGLDSGQLADSRARSLEWARSIEPRTVESSPFHRNNPSREDAQRTRDVRLASCDAG